MRFKEEQKKSRQGSEALPVIRWIDNIQIFDGKFVMRNGNFLIPKTAVKKRMSELSKQYFQFKKGRVRKVLESDFLKLKKGKKQTFDIRKAPNSEELGAFMVAEAGLEPTTSGL